MSAAGQAPVSVSATTGRQRLSQCALLVLATFAAYLPAIRAGFIWNDRDYVTAPALRSLDGLRRIWFELGATEQYYPVLHSFFWFQQKLWGDSPAGYHLVNIGLHAACACMLAVLLLRLGVRGAWLAAGIFALHPVYVESVAWISEQKNTLSTLLYLLTGWLYLRFDASRKPAHYWMAVALFCIALLSKSVTATLPPALLVVFWWKRGRLDWKRDVGPLLPFFALGAAFGLFSGWVEREFIGAHGEDFALSTAQRVLIAGRAAWFYLGKLIWPADLIFIYPRWTPDPAVRWQWLFPIATLLLLAGLYVVSRYRRGPLAAVLFFGGSLVPVLGFFNIYAFIFSFVADHWQYQPSIGMVVLGGAAIAIGLSRAPRPVQLGVPLLLLAGLGVLSFRQSRMYRDMETFYRVTLARNPNAWMAHNNLGELLHKRGQLDEARQHYQIALNLRPRLAEAHNNLGTLLATTTGLEEGIGHFAEALRIEPKFSEARSNLGLHLARIPGRLTEALPHLETAIAQRPEVAMLHRNLAAVLAQIPGRQADAIARYEIALRIDPNVPEFHNELAAELARIPGREAEAIHHYEQALRLQPSFAEAHNNIANVLAKLPGRMEDALAHYRAALALNPNFAAAHFNLANKLAGLGQTADAIAHYTAAFRAEPRFAAAHYRLAEVLANDPARVTEAIEHYLVALRADPASVPVRVALARAYARNRQPDAAIDLLEAVLRDQPDDAAARELLAGLKQR